MCCDMKVKRCSFLIILSCHLILILFSASFYSYFYIPGRRCAHVLRNGDWSTVWSLVLFLFHIWPVLETRTWLFSAQTKMICWLAWTNEWLSFDELRVDGWIRGKAVKLNNADVASAFLTEPGCGKLECDHITRVYPQLCTWGNIFKL